MTSASIEGEIMKRDWGFDRVGANKYDGGASVISKIFGSSSSLAKEPIQNAVDRISEANKNFEGKITIEILEFSGKTKDKILEALGWSNLRPHIEAIISTDSGAYADRLKKSLERIESDEALKFLAISDYGTLGIPGDDFNRSNHIFRLTRSAHVTDDSQKNRDGSHGLGKGIFWKYSGISTVLFYSLTCHEDIQQSSSDTFEQKALLNKNKLDHRLIGQASLANHQVNGIDYQQIGFFGISKDTEDGQAIVSSWGQDDLIDLLGVVREEKNENTGTTILVMDFNDPKSEEEKNGSQEIDELEESATRWFWPALSRKRR